MKTQIIQRCLKWTLLLVSLIVFVFPIWAQQPAFLTNGLVAFFPFDGSAKDASGNGNDGVESLVQYTTNRFSQGRSAVLFEQTGTPNSVFVPGPLFHAGQSDFSLFAWVCLPDISEANSIGTLFNTMPHTGLALGFGSPRAGEMRYSLGTGSGWTSVEQFIGIGDWHQNVWKHVGMVKKGSSITLYADGVLVQTSAVESTFVVDCGLLIGTADPSSQVPGDARYNLHGFVDDVRVYDHALSGTEVIGVYNYQNSAPLLRSATATAVLANHFVVDATIIDGGIGYTKAPKVVILGGGGSGATAIASIDENGSVVAIKILTSGSGYTGTPTIAIDPPPYPPSQAKGTAMVVNGFVTGVSITDTGHGYEGAIPPVTFLGGGGIGAKGTPIVTGGMVTGISMTASGSGYTNAPFVLIAAPPGLVSAAISVRTVDVTLSLTPGYTYKIQTTTDAGNSWVDVESGILAVEKTVVRRFDVTSQSQLFRVVQLN